MMNSRGTLINPSFPRKWASLSRILGGSRLRGNDKGYIGQSFSRRSIARGFTLLEVMVALTITGLALGGLFGVIAGSKRLAWRAEQALVHSSQIRSLINFSQLNNEHGEVFISWENDDLTLITGAELTTPERKTMTTNEELRGFEITDENGERVAQGTYWMFPEVPTPVSSGAQSGNEEDGLGLPAGAFSSPQQGGAPLGTRGASQQRDSGQTFPFPAGPLQ